MSCYTEAITSPRFSCFDRAAVDLAHLQLCRDAAGVRLYDCASGLSHVHLAASSTAIPLLEMATFM